MPVTQLGFQRHPFLLFAFKLKINLQEIMKVQVLYLQRPQMTEVTNHLELISLPTSIKAQVSHLYLFSCREVPDGSRRVRLCRCTAGFHD